MKPQRDAFDHWIDAFRLASNPNARRLWPSGSLRALRLAVAPAFVSSNARSTISRQAFASCAPFSKRFRGEQLNLMLAAAAWNFRDGCG